MKTPKIYLSVNQATHGPSERESFPARWHCLSRRFGSEVSLMSSRTFLSVPTTTKSTRSCHALSYPARPSEFAPTEQVRDG
jgi:hypothetical protein